MTRLAPAARTQRPALLLVVLTAGWVACGAPGGGADTAGTGAHEPGAAGTDGGVGAPEVPSQPDALESADVGVEAPVDDAASETDAAIAGRADGSVDLPADAPDPPDGHDAAIVGTDGSDATFDPGGRRDPVARGSYLVRAVLACGSCHSPLPTAGAAPDPGLFLSGRDCFATIGILGGGTTCLDAPNLTPGPTGIGRYSDGQLASLIFDGMRPDGTPLLEAYMPSYQFRLLTDDDAAAVIAYLRSLPPVPRTGSGRDPRSLDDAAASLSLADLPVGAGGPGERGRYLAGVACVSCHSPQADIYGLRPIDVSRAFTGGQMYAGLGRVVYAPNLTTAHPDGADAHVESIVRAMRTGMGRDGSPLCSRMPGGPGAAYAQLSDDDARAIAGYLASLPSRGDVVPRVCDSP